MKAIDYFRSIAAVLGDDEPNRPFQRYPLRDLIMAYNRGSAIVRAYRPDLFTVIKKVKLEAGSRQNARGCCDNVLNILEQVDANGNVIKELSVTKTAKPKGSNRTSWVHKASCLNRTDMQGAGVHYVIDSASLDNSMNGLFKVIPPVPPNVEAYVNVKCVQPSCDFREDLINGELVGDDLHNTALWHYVISAMLVGDRHATGATAESQNHFTMFTKILDIQHKMERVAEMEVQADGVR